MVLMKKHKQAENHWMSISDMMSALMIIFLFIAISFMIKVNEQKKDMDKIQFEYRYEVQELMKVIDKYVKQNPAEKENKTLERFFDLLDVMDMEW